MKRLALVLILTGACLRAGTLALPEHTDFSILPPPPGDTTPAGLADLSVLLYVQAARTPAQAEMAKEMSHASVFDLNRDVFGDWFRRENLPRTSGILREVMEVTKPVLQAAKAHWKRPRPYVRSAEISPVVGRPGDAGSYPSGHTFGIAVPEFVLAAAFPELAGALDRQTHRMMWGRIAGGVHYPSDTEAGRLLAQELVRRLLQTAEMQRDLDVIRAEMAPFMNKAAGKTAAETQQPGAGARQPE